MNTVSFNELYLNKLENLDGWLSKKYINYEAGLDGGRREWDRLCVCVCVGGLDKDITLYTPRNNHTSAVYKIIKHLQMVSF